MIGRLGAVLPIFVLAAEISVFPQAPTFTVKSEEVRVDVLVSDHGKPVHGLGPNDFEVFDNGVRQEISFASQEHIPFSAVLVLDMSASVAGPKLANLKDAGLKFLDRLKRDERVALVTFSEAVHLMSNLTTDLVQVRNRFEQLQPYGNTSLIDACYAGVMIGESRPGRPLIIVFSDGLDTSSWLTDDAVLDIAKVSDAVVYSVSAGRLPRETFLRDISRATGGSLFEIESTQNLSTLFLNILEEFRQRYLLTFPIARTQKGWHRLEVKVKGRSVSVKARPGYLTEF